MIIEFDPVKNAKNIADRSLSFDRVIDFDFETAVYGIDDRHDYGEIRRIAAGYLDGRLHILCFAVISGGIRVISFRKANTREARRYDKQITTD